MRYWPFGAERSGTAPERGYTGQQKEPLLPLGMYYYKARFYSTATAHFVSADPNLTDSGTQVRPIAAYSYVAHNPIRLADPSGECVPGIDNFGACAEPCRACSDLQMLADAAMRRPDIDWDDIASCGGGASCFNEVTGFRDNCLGWSCTPFSPINRVISLIERIGSFEVAPGLTVEDVVLAGRMPGRPLTSTVRTKSVLDDVLRPQGATVGTVGSKTNIRVVKGGDEAAWRMFESMARGGEIVKNTDYPGILVKLPNNRGVVGFRESRQYGLTIDINVSNESVKRIHFAE